MCINDDNRRLAQRISYGTVAHLRRISSAGSNSVSTLGIRTNEAVENKTRRYGEMRTSQTNFIDMLLNTRRTFFASA